MLNSETRPACASPPRGSGSLTFRLELQIALRANGPVALGFSPGHKAKLGSFLCEKKSSDLFLICRRSQNMLVINHRSCRQI